MIDDHIKKFKGKEKTKMKKVVEISLEVIVSRGGVDQMG